MTKVSIIIPCYNHGQYLDEAIKSVEENGSKTAYEIIIINDGSTDPYTIDKLKELETKGKGYRIIHQENQGLGKTRNNGIKQATGEYIIPLDADNKLSKGFIDKCSHILDTDLAYAVVYTDCFHFNEQENYLSAVGDFDILRLIHTNYIDACSMYRKKVWEVCGGYDSNMPGMGNEDWDLWLNMAFHGSKFYYLAEPLYYYRLSPGSMRLNVTQPKFKENLEYLLEKYKGPIAKHYHQLYERYSNYEWLYKVYMRKNKFKSIAKTLFNKWSA